MTGPELKALRLAHGWRQRDVAEALGYLHHTVTQWERGDRPVPHPVAAWAWALPPPRQPLGPSYPQDRAGLAQWMADHGLREAAAARLLGVTPSTLAHWLHHTEGLPLAVRHGLRLGMPLAWRPRPVPLLPRSGRYQRHPLRPAPLKAPDRTWIPTETGGYMPPAGYCIEGQDFDQRPGCRVCAYRADCAEVAQEDALGARFAALMRMEHETAAALGMRHPDEESHE